MIKKSGGTMEAFSYALGDADVYVIFGGSGYGHDGAPTQIGAPFFMRCGTLQMQTDTSRR
ncbi:MAG: GYD domain-containing protein [Gemmatimonadota bacterium]|nr:GYD domain-containing protein [Gemmatimonadota bacterium]